MNLTDSRYSQFALVREMMETPAVVERFDANQAADTAAKIKSVGRLLLTGEGSSRIFPAKNMISQARRRDVRIELHTDAGRQSQEYKLDQWAVFGASNSGKTSEIIKLFTDLKARGHQNLFGLTAAQNSKLSEIAHKTYVLCCGGEDAVAATKSVVEQAVFYHALLDLIAGER